MYNFPLITFNFLLFLKKMIVKIDKLVNDNYYIKKYK